MLENRNLTSYQNSWGGVGGEDERCSRRARLEIRADSYLSCHLGRSLKTMETDRGRKGGRDGCRLPPRPTAGPSDLAPEAPTLRNQFKRSLKKRCGELCLWLVLLRYVFQFLREVFFTLR